MSNNDALVDFAKRVFFGIERKDLGRGRNKQGGQEAKEKRATKNAGRGEEARGGAAEEDEVDSKEESYDVPYEFLVAVGDIESDWDDSYSGSGSAAEFSSTYEHAWL
jgi:hypothetical protein